MPETLSSCDARRKRHSQLARSILSLESPLFPGGETLLVVFDSNNEQPLSNELKPDLVNCQYLASVVMSQQNGAQESDEASRAAAEAVMTQIPSLRAVHARFVAARPAHMSEEAAIAEADHDILSEAHDIGYRALSHPGGPGQAVAEMGAELLLGMPFAQHRQALTAIYRRELNNADPAYCMSSMSEQRIQSVEQGFFLMWLSRLPSDREALTSLVRLIDAFRYVTEDHNRPEMRIGGLEVVIEPIPQGQNYVPPLQIRHYGPPRGDASTNWYEHRHCPHNTALGTVSVHLPPFAMAIPVRQRCLARLVGSTGIHHLDGEGHVQAHCSTRRH